jgi:DnaJ-class molecular chaperone
MNLEEQHSKDLIQMGESESINTEICDECHGSGMIGDGDCSSCNGRGVI